VHIVGSSVIRKGFSLSKAMEILERLGVDQIKAEHVRLPEGSRFAVEGEEWAKYLEDVKGLRRHYVDYLSSGIKPLDYRFSSKIMQLLFKKRRDWFCAAGAGMFGISTDGEYYPCSLHAGRPGARLGSVDEGIKADKAELFREKYKVQNRTDCSKCWARHLCGGGCSAMVDRFGSEPCDLLKTEAETAIAIYHTFAESDPVALLSLVSPALVKWAGGDGEKHGEPEFAKETPIGGCG
jgi:uncharacterized protein